MNHYKYVKVFIFVFLVGIFLNSKLQAQEIKKHHFYAASVLSHFDYDEPDMAEEGVMYGLNASYEYANPSFMIHVNMEYLYGELDYDGRTFGGSEVSADTEDHIYDFRILTGRSSVYEGYTFTPFIGLATRYWNDNIKGSNGYEREITAYYLPIVLRVDKPLSTTWLWRLNAEYDLFIDGKVKSHLSDIDPAYNDPENKQDFGEGYGMRASLRFTNRISQNYSFYIEPFFRYWDVKDSDYSRLKYNGATVAGVYEPENKTKMVGSYIGVSF